MATTNDLLEQILITEPSPITVRTILISFMDDGRYNQVIRYGTEALHRNPNDVELMKILAQAYGKIGFFGQAEDMLQRACSCVDDFSVLFKQLGKLYASRNRNDQAIVCLKKYLSHFPEDEDTVELLRELQKAGETPEADKMREIPEAPEFVEAGPEEAPQETPSLKDLATPTLAEIYFNQGQIKEAIEIYRNVLARHPDDLEAAKRLEELEAMVQGPAYEEQTPEQPPYEESLVVRKERMITVLESWLGKIQEMNRAF